MIIFAKMEAVALLELEMEHTHVTVPTDIGDVIVQKLSTEDIIVCLTLISAR